MNTKKELVNEIFVIRVIACLAIVLLHSITSTLGHFKNIDSFTHELLIALQMALIFGTPVFIFISEFLLSKAQKQINKHFFLIRFKLLLLPYFSMAIVYAFLETESFQLNIIGMTILKNIFLADYVGYFIVIIFQFYILHFIYQKYLNNLNPVMVLSISLFVNITYLAFFNFISPFEQIPHSEYIWNRLSWLPFTGWIFYFSMGYYCGLHFQFFRNFIIKYKNLLFFGTLFSLISVITLQNLGLPEKVSSKRVDILILTTFLIPTLFYYSSKIRKVPFIIFVISNYSFSIYLLHKIFMHFLIKLPINHLAIFIISLFFLSVAGSIFIAWIMNKFSLGKYMVGNVTNFKGRKKGTKKVAELAG